MDRKQIEKLNDASTCFLTASVLGMVSCGILNLITTFWVAVAVSCFAMLGLALTARSLDRRSKQNEP